MKSKKSLLLFIYPPPLVKAKKNERGGMGGVVFRESKTEFDKFPDTFPRPLVEFKWIKSIFLAYICYETIKYHYRSDRPRQEECSFFWDGR